MSSDWFAPDSLAEARGYYVEQGYAVIRGLVDPTTCDQVRRTFDVVKARPTPILRQHNMRYERNRFDQFGNLANPIFNVQDLRSRLYGPFQRAVQAVIASPQVARVVRALLDVEQMNIVQTMYFEANVGTWAHQDSYYQDSEALGTATAAWFALEDIAEGAGRFYVVPGSHNWRLVENSGEFDVAFHHAAYKRHMEKLVDKHGYVAPALRKGDALFWSSLTIHGSLRTTAPQHSRRSLTTHYFRAQDRMVQFHSRIKPLHLSPYGEFQINQLHDQNVLANRLIGRAFYHFPRTMAAARNLAIRTVQRRAGA